MGTPDTGLEHSTAPHWNLLRPAKIVNLHRRRVSTHASQLNIDNAAGTQVNRRSRVLYDIDGFHDLLGRRIMHTLPLLNFRLGIPPFQVSSIEMQLTASSDGEFFRAHTDSGYGPISGRTITFVYFCHREPRMFAGGTLRIYARDPATGGDLMELGQDVEPTQNSIVFFASDRLHEIISVGCQSRAVLDSRMTLNGWLHR